MNFTNSEKVDMLEVYFRADKNATLAVNTYIEQYPDRQVPNSRVFKKLIANLRRNGSFKSKRDKRNTAITEENEADILAFFQVHPNSSIRKVTKIFPLSYGSICSILKKNGYHPFKAKVVQTLMPGDAHRRMEFCGWFAERAVENDDFPSNVIWTDETNFSNRGMYNRRNHHFWSNKNPIEVHEGRDQFRFSLNCWCLLMGNRILAIHFYEGNLTGNRYREFLEEVLFPNLDDIPLGRRMNLYFQQDGAPAHNSEQVRGLLEGSFPGKWMATNGPIKWPARSPDLTPLDFFLWGYLKDKLYTQKYGSVEEMRNKIMELLQNIHHTKISAATNDVVKRAHACLFVDGGHFEHLF